MAFGKKKKEEKKETATVEANLDGKKEVPPAPIPEELREKIEIYHKYTTAFGLEDVASTPSAGLQAETMNLLFAMFSEIVEMRKVLEQIRENE